MEFVTKKDLDKLKSAVEKLSVRIKAIENEMPAKKVPSAKRPAKKR